MLVPFTKAHGCGNDFVLVDRALTGAQAAFLADRHRGVGCDQVITLQPTPHADVFARFYNPDGGEAGACGNGTRCVLAVLGRPDAVIRTVAGDLPARRLEDGRVQVDMGPPRLDWAGIPLAGPLDTLSLPIACGPVAGPAAASMGNPHATFFVADLRAVDPAAIGPALERHALFPERANVGFAQMLGRGRMRLRVWERGAGLTLACGSGACAAVVNAVRRGLADPQVAVDVDGGTLDILWRPTDKHVLMTGPATIVFTGEIDLDDGDLPDEH